MLFVNKLQEMKTSQDLVLADTEVKSEQQIDLDKVRKWLEKLLWNKKYGMDVYRCKGILRVRKSDELHTLQGVREIYEIVPSRKWRNEEIQMSKIVFIGRFLNEEILLNSLHTSVVGTD
ncbi:hypothetical protein RND71_023626 [Anisodus tanguticus]|uniref:CobW C-terminal domain-containing protein n=1 Tax=Anisodus tanguticus TaxID=243964 RepID=A0AAE1VBR6_9SOLA|nr:hypothetical protein RND71_023626 [Anisodus tanguticus]